MRHLAHLGGYRVDRDGVRVPCASSSWPTSAHVLSGFLCKTLLRSYLQEKEGTVWEEEEEEDDPLRWFSLYQHPFLNQAVHVYGQTHPRSALRLAFKDVVHRFCL
jgi:hypothetical protein